MHFQSPRLITVVNDNGILNPPKGIGGREGLKPTPTLIDVFAVAVCRLLKAVL
jgi:hypothetical protein